jgi:hypothetical protein
LVVADIDKMADLSCPITPVTEEEKRRKVVRGLQAIRDLPIARSGGLILGVRELDALVFAMNEYLTSDNKSTPPTKDLLRAAVLSLLQEGVALSAQWNKSQLALIVQKWALSAIQLSPRHAQANLFVQTTMAVEKRKKVLRHKCWLKDEGSEEVVEFSIASPSPVKARKPARDASISRETSEGNETDLYELSDVDESFLKEIDALAQQADLAAIPVHFYTPGVNTIPGRDFNAGSHEGPYAQRGSGPASSTRACIDRKFVALLCEAIKKHYSAPQLGGDSRPARSRDSSNPHADEDVQGTPRMPGTVSVTSAT